MEEWGETELGGPRILQKARGGGTQGKGGSSRGTVGRKSQRGLLLSQQRHLWWGQLRATADGVLSRLPGRSSAPTTPCRGPGHTAGELQICAEH